MFFLGRLELDRKLTQLRQQYNSTGISDELRGWNWERPPIQPPRDNFFLSVSELANRYCETYRDIYLKRVADVESQITIRMIEGLVIHSVSQQTVSLVKKYLYQNGIVCGYKLIEDLVALQEEVCSNAIEKALTEERLPEHVISNLMNKASSFYQFLVVQAGARLDQSMTQFPHSDVDSVISQILLPVVERKIDGSLIGLSRELSVDMYTQGPMIIELKTGEPKVFHKYSVVGYSLAVESEDNIDINYGLIVYIRFTDNRQIPKISLESFVVSDELRREFLELRDEAIEVLAAGKDPGLPPSCPLLCSYYHVCHPDRDEEARVAEQVETSHK